MTLSEENGSWSSCPEETQDWTYWIRVKSTASHIRKVMRKTTDKELRETLEAIRERNENINKEKSYKGPNKTRDKHTVTKIKFKNFKGIQQ